MVVWGHSDKGRVRKDNQDAYAFGNTRGKKISFAVVCDGMGGAAAGNIASELALSAFVSVIKKSEIKTAAEAQMKTLLEDAVSEANSAVHGRAEEDDSLHGMGTTLVSAVSIGGRVGVVNVGDSRAYKVSEQGIFRITRDHSLVEDMVQMGELTEKQAQVHPGKNLITRAVGTDSKVSADIYFPEITKGDFILLCSDGLSNLVTEQEILYEVLYGGKHDSCCKRLSDIANSRGGYDNITAVLVSF